MDTRNKLLESFFNKCRRFEIEQLQKDLLVDFLPTDFWNEVFEEIEDASLDMNHTLLKPFLLKAVENKRNEEIEDKIIALHFFDAMYHSHKRTWSAFVIKLQKAFFSCAQHLKMELETSVKSLDVPILVMTETHSNLIWILLVEKKRTGKKETAKKYSTPTYCAFSIDTNHLFVSRRNIPDKTMEVLRKTFQCSSLRYCDLFSKNINGLVTMLRRKLSSSKLTLERQQKKKFKPDVVRSSTGNDYTIETQAKEYVKSLFDEDPEPQLQQLCIKAKGYKLPSKDNSEDVKVDTRLVFKSKNIPKFLESLAGMGVLKMPVAEYLNAFPSSGKNDLTCAVEQTK